jgi:outer membrane phospholipase A
MKNIILLLVLLFSARPAFAADAAYTLMVPSAPVVAGAEVRVDLAALNPGALEAPFGAPLSIAGKLLVGGEEHDVTLDSVSSAPVAVSPGGFAARRYRLRLPPGVTGRVVLEVQSSGFGLLRGVLDVQPPAVAQASEAAPAAAAPETPLEQLSDAAPVASGLARTFAGRFMPNQPIYFLYGNTDQAVKFQFSFDYKLAALHWGKPEAQKISTVRLGYTQRSLWDIEGSSSPFYDTSYMPELAFHTDSTMPRTPSWFTWMGWRVSFQHESNGRDGADSRSMNTVYFRPRFVLGDLDGWYAVMIPEIWGYVGGVEDNPEIKDYRGYGKLKFYLGKNTGPSLRVAAWSGEEWNHGSYQLDLTWPIKTQRLSLETFFQIQYFNGYGESLRSYDEKSEALRFGIGLVR